MTGRTAAAFQGEGQLLTAQPGATLAPAERARIAEAARKFEAMAIGQLLTPMFNTVDTSKGLFGGGEAEAAWKPMMIEEVAKKIAGNGGFGLANPVMQQMLRAQEAKTQAMTEARSRENGR